VPVHNSEIAEIFNEIADLLEIDGANPFRVRAYREAAATIETLSKSAEDMIEEGEDLTEISGVGQDLAEKIEEIVETGSLDQLKELRQQVPPSLAGMMDISSLGPERVGTIYEELGVTTLDELEAAAQEGRIRELHGFGEKIEQDILEGLERVQGEEYRTLLRTAEEVIEPLIEYLRECGELERAEVAGSYRRRKETVGDVDIVAQSDTGGEVIQWFVNYEDVEEVISEGETRSTVRLRSGLQVDLRVVSQQSYGSTLQYFTGSVAHNVRLRNMALDRELKLNEYGVFRDEERIAGETEAEVYEVFNLPFIAPELREDRGEIEAAQKGELPELIELEDIRGDLQCHTQYSDGRATLDGMVQAARERGYEYLAISDHSAFIGITQGLDEQGLEEQIEEIDLLNEKLEDFRVLKAVEVDILEDGSFALPDDILEKLDFRICSIHSKFDLSREKQTDRILRAMDNPNFNILAHPTGRQLGDRPGYQLDFGKVMEKALELGCYLEVNAYPNRLDLDDVHCKMAKDLGLRLAISTDSHRKTELAYMRYGVGQARRGWLTSEDVLNTRSWSDLKGLMQRS